MTKEKQKGEGLKMYNQEPEWGPQHPGLHGSAVS